MGDLRTRKNETAAVGLSSLLHDPLKDEICRRHTFKQNHDKLNDSDQLLAAKGFYQPHSVPNKVQCFSCGLRLDYPLTFSTDQINSEHGKLNPDCEFLKQIGTTKSTPGSGSGSSSSCVETGSSSSGCYNKNNNNTNSNSSVPCPNPNNSNCCSTAACSDDVSTLRHMSISSMNPRNNQIQQQADRCATSNNRSSSGNSPVHSAMEQASRMIIADNSSSRNELGNTYNNPAAINYDAMKSEVERLKTFSVYPAWSSSFIHPLDCARAGFFFLHDGDKVQCAFCRGVAGEWEEGDVPIAEHRRHFPRCPFICGLPVGNIPRNQSQTESNENSPVPSSNSNSSSESNESNEGIDICGPFSAEQMRSHALTNSRTLTLRGAQPLSGNLDDVAKNLLIRPCRGPTNANMVTEQARLKSFKHKNWSASVAQSPEQLAKAGFYYIGFEDHVKCFYCGGGLRNWEGGEDPWVEHAKWFPRCTFLQLNKGDEFIESVARTTTGSQKKGTENNNNPTSPSAYSPTTSGGSSGSGSSSDEEEATSPSPPSEQEEPSTSSSKSPNKSTNKGKKNSDEASSSGNSSGEDEAPTLSDSNRDLEDEVQRLREARVCKICMDNEVSVVFLPCGHLISCTTCATAFSNCALCRQPIEAVVRTYMS